MHTGVAHIAFEHLSIADGVAQHGVGRSLRFLQLGNAGDGIRQIHLALLAVFIVGQFIGDEFTQCVRSVERQYAVVFQQDGAFAGKLLCNLVGVRRILFRSVVRRVLFHQFFDSSGGLGDIFL